MLFVDPLLLPDNFKKLLMILLSSLMKFIVKGIRKIHLICFSHSKECNATHLGYSSNNSKGKGVSMQMLDQFFSYVKSSIIAVKRKH